MKKSIFLIVILSCFGFTFAHQPTPYNPSAPSHNENKRILFGIAVGPTVDWFAPTFQKIEREKAKGGLIAGLHLDINLTKESFLYFSTGLLVRYLQGDISYTKQYNFSKILPMDTSLIVPTVTTYQTTYLTVPTGIKFRASFAKKCVFAAKLGLYHNFRVGGKMFDNFSLPGKDPDYFVTTKKEKNTHAALFAESAYLGVGFEYALGTSSRVFVNADYSCQFNYFNSKATSNISNERFKSIIHSLHIAFGILF